MNKLTHTPINTQSDQQQQQLTPSNTKLNKYADKQLYNNLIQLIFYVLLFMCLFGYAIYQRMVLYPQAIQAEDQKIQKYIENSYNISRILNNIPQMTLNSDSYVKTLNSDLNQLIGILQKQKVMHHNNQNQEKGNHNNLETKSNQFSELEQFQKNLDNKMAEKYGSKIIIDDQEEEVIIDFKQIAGITKQKVIAAKRYRKLLKQSINSQSQRAITEFQYYQSQYSISKYDELPFCIVVPTYMNQQNERYKKNIDSIIQQNYSNYHVVIIQDASTDNTGKLIDEYVQNISKKYPSYHFQQKIKIIHNQESKRALPNLRRAALQFCKPEQIFLIADGDDELIGRQVLKLFNSQFQQQRAWFIYSNSITHIGSLGFSRYLRGDIKQNNKYRKSAFTTSHLRAFYTQLFRKIKQEDLQDQNGNYFKAANDVAICIPILQMCHERVAYIPQVTYLYNSNTGFNNHKIRFKQQTQNNKKIRNYESYKPLDKLFQK